MEEKEKKPWRPPEAAHLPDPIAFAMQGFERFGLPKERLIPPLQTFDRVMQHSAFTENRWWENARQVTAVRNMFGYTGTYKGKKVSVMGSGMGMASIGIYSYELYKFYDVDTIIRVGSTGSYSQRLKLKDVALIKATKADTAGNISLKPQVKKSIFQLLKPIPIPVMYSTMNQVLNNLKRW